MYLILIIIFLGICIPAFYNGLKLRRYSVTSDFLNLEQGLRIAVVSDLHNTRQRKLIGMIKEMNPHIIAMTGDIIDTKYTMKYVNVFLDELAALGIPIYYVTGNHEIGSLQTDEIKSDLKKRGIIVLEDEFVKINVNGIKLIIAGVDDPYKSDIDDWKNNVNNKLSPIKRINCYKILLAHRPDLWEIYQSFGFDLVLSGHAHGGQVRIPYLINGLYAPHQGFFPKYAGGLYKHGKLNHAVSRGLSMFINLPRVFNRPELLQIDITSNHNT